MKSYVTLVGGDGYLPGAIALQASLLSVQSSHPLLALVTPDVSEASRALLQRCGLSVAPTEPIAVKASLSEAQQHWADTYTKLRVFGLTSFTKVVFLDADMIVAENIDGLFDRPHMTAVAAGGFLPGRESWKKLNSGLLVIEPSQALLEDMLAQLPALYVPTGGDQDFLHAYYPSWPDQPELQLPFRYNVFHKDLNDYARLIQNPPFGGPQGVAVVHYIGKKKPWHQITQIETFARNTGSVRNRLKRLGAKVGLPVLPDEEKLPAMAQVRWLEHYKMLPHHK